MLCVCTVRAKSRQNNGLAFSYLIQLVVLARTTNTHFVVINCFCPAFFFFRVMSLCASCTTRVYGSFCAECGYALCVSCEHASDSSLALCHQCSICGRLCCQWCALCHSTCCAAEVPSPELTQLLNVLGTRPDATVCDIIACARKCVSDNAVAFCLRNTITPKMENEHLLAIEREVREVEFFAEPRTMRQVRKWMSTGEAEFNPQDEGRRRVYDRARKIIERQTE